jgi:hypothetical protein
MPAIVQLRKRSGELCKTNPGISIMTVTINLSHLEERLVCQQKGNRLARGQSARWVDRFIYTMTDPIAERAREIGRNTLRSIRQIGRLQRFPDNNASYVEPQKTFAELQRTMQV